MNEKLLSVGAAICALPCALSVYWHTGDPAEAGLWLLVAVWMAWRAWKDWPAGIKPGDGATRACALLGWMGCAWIVSGLWPQDHGLLKLALPAITAGVLAILWGPSRLVNGWRVLLISVLWVLEPAGVVIDRIFAGPRLESFTAAFAAAGLWQIGDQVSRTGALIATDAGSIVVRYGCTAVPLWALLARLILPAAITFGLPWRRLLVLALASAASAFAVSVVRVMVLARTVGDTERFLYWHGDEGAGWFTLAAFAVFAALLARLAGRETPDERPRAAPALAKVLLAAGLAASVLAAVRLASSPAHQEARPLAGPEKAGHWVRVSASPLPLPGEHAAGDRPAWLGRFVYMEENTFSSLAVTAAEIPVWLDGDPLDLADLWRLLADRSRAEWRPTDLASPAEGGRALRKGRGWLASIHETGGILCEPSEWLPLSKRVPSDLAAWGNWFLGRRPLRQKSGLWIALDVERGDPLSADQTAAVLAAWRDCYLSSIRQHRDP